MSVIIIHFGDFSKKTWKAFTFTHYMLAKDLYNKNLLKKVICKEYNKNNIDIPNEYFVEINKVIIFKIAYRLFKKIKRVYPRFNRRHYEEILFDLIASIFIRKIKTKLLYCSKPLFPICINFCKKRGIKVLVRASIAHPLYNYFLVRNEEIKCQLPNISSYSNYKRAVKLSKVFHESDKILVPHPKVAKFTFNTYRFAFDSKKIIKQKQIYCLNDTRKLPEKMYDTEDMSKSLNFISVSHMNLIKGVHYLLEAWDRFINTYKGEATLFLIGTIDKQILELYKRKYTQLKGVVLKNLMKNPFEKFTNADALICSSISDNGPGTIIEAMNFGIPIISSKNCGLSEIIEDEKEGFTYEFNDVVKLSEILHWFALNRSKVNTMRKNVINKVNIFSKENYIKEINSILKENR